MNLKSGSKCVIQDDTVNKNKRCFFSNDDILKNLMDHHIDP